MTAAQAPTLGVFTPKQQEAYNILLKAPPDSYTLLGYGGSAGGGKALSYDNLVVTPFGQKRMGDVEVGDQVSNPDGSVARVIAIHPQGEQDLYRITFDDGATCEVTADHLWQVKEASKARFRKVKVEDRPTQWRVATTASLIQEIQKKRLLIPLTAPVEFTVTARNPEALYPVHPYILGVVLGDGHMAKGSVSVSSGDPELIEHLRELGAEPTLIEEGKNHQVVRLRREIYDSLCAMGLKDRRAWDKFIPKNYLASPLWVRWELVMGLMDTDGYADSRGHMSLTSTSQEMAEQFRWIAHSLGFKCSITTKIPTFTYKGEKKLGRRAYTVWLKGTGNEQVFSLARKQGRAKAYNGGVSERTRRIVSIEFSRRAEAKCITVDHPNGLFLTDDFIVTHNSFLEARIAYEFAVAYPGTRILVGRKALTTLKTTTMSDFYRIVPPRMLMGQNDTENWAKIRNPAWPEGIYSQVFFRGLDDYLKSGSEAYQVIIVDEASELDHTAHNFLLTRLRWKLPKVVSDVKARQCRFNEERIEKAEIQGQVIEYPVVVPCNRVIKSGDCPLHGGDYIGNGVKYFYICASNPWPGWFTDVFWKRSMDETLEQLAPGNKVHFVHALPNDNPHLPKNYVAMLRGSMATTPDLAARLIEGRFDVFTGLVYEVFDPGLHAWTAHELPKYSRVIGGLDFGSENSTGHMSAGIVGIVTQTNRIIWVDEFYERGANIAERQQLWMAKMEKEWAHPIGKSIQWRADKSQMVGIQQMRKSFRVAYSKGGPDSVEEGVKVFARYLNKDDAGIPGMFYLPHLEHFRTEMQEYRRDPETLKIIKKGDDLMDASRYAIESLDNAFGDPNVLLKNRLARIA